MITLAVLIYVIISIYIAVSFRKDGFSMSEAFICGFLALPILFSYLLGSMLIGFICLAIISWIVTNFP